eukprot:jgi/Mesvir1/1656/Mv02146-RA.1
MREKLKGNTLEMWVPIPRGYTSDLVTHIRKASVQKTLAGPNNGSAAMAYLCLEKESPDTMYLAWYYSRPRQFPNIADDAEKDKFKGMGHRMLCYAVRQMKPLMDRSAGTLMMTLNASGGDCPHVAPYPELTLEDLKEKFEQYPKSRAHPDVKEAFRTKDENLLRIYWCDIEQNQQLVNNYKTYGLSPYNEEDGFQILMKGTLDNVERACATGGTRRTPTLTNRERDVIDQRRGNGARTVTPDKIDPTYAGTPLFPVSRATGEQFAEKKREHREFQWKSVDGATTRLRLVSADGKLGLVEIVSSPEQSNHVPIEVQRASGVGVMDAETAVQTIRDKNAPDWTVAGGGPVGMSSAYEDMMYVVLKRVDSTDHKLVLFRPVVVTENKAFKDVSASRREDE